MNLIKVIKGKLRMPSRVKLPHEKWPQLLHWEPGDIIGGGFRLIVFTEIGDLFVENLVVGGTQRLDLERYVDRNTSYQERTITQESKPYMEFIKECQLALVELET